MEKTFTVIGTSVLNGVLKIRFANGLEVRNKVLARNGHTAINLIECPEASKVGAVKFAIAQEDRFNTEERALFAEYIKSNDF
jgi:hypothetical protein